MNIYESAENYLETILILKNKYGTVRSIDIANELGFSKPSVSIAMKKLRESSHINMDSDGSISLTEDGLAIAKSVYERHTNITRWLIELGVDAITAAEDACRIEHVISQETFNKIRDHINNKLK